MHRKHSINITLISIDSKALESYKIRAYLLRLHKKQTRIIALNVKVTLVLFPAVCLYGESSVHVNFDQFNDTAANQKPQQCPWDPKSLKIRKVCRKSRGVSLLGYTPTLPTLWESPIQPEAGGHGVGWRSWGLQDTLLSDWPQKEMQPQNGNSLLEGSAFPWT